MRKFIIFQVGIHDTELDFIWTSAYIGEINVLQNHMHGRKQEYGTWVLNDDVIDDALDVEE